MSTSNIIGIIGLILTATGIIIAIKTCDVTQQSISSSCKFQPCMNSNKTKVTIPVSNSNARPIKRENYHEINEFITVSDVNYSTDETNKYREDIFDQAYQHIIKNIPALVRETVEQKFNSKTFKKDDIWNQKSSVVNSLIHVGKEQRIFDCNTCEYRHEITFYIPKSIQDIFPKDLNHLLKEGIDHSLDEQFNRNDGQELHIDIGEIIVNMLSNESFLEKGREIIPKYGTNNYDDETNQFFDQIVNGKSVVNFKSSQYQINAVSALAIEHFKSRLEELFYDNPNSKFEITSIGYTDPNSIKSHILYARGGRYSNDPGTPISIEEGSSFPLIGDSIKNNTQLSYARAYSGIGYLYQNLASTFKQSGNKESYIFQYKGNGVDYSNNNNWLKRRVVFKINNVGKIY